MLIKLKLFCYLSIAGLFLFSPLSVIADEVNAQSVAGYWQTMDGKTKKPSSIIHVYPQGQHYDGKVVKGSSLPDEQTSNLCIKCKGDEKNKPIVGMVIVKNMSCFDGKCHSGTILDPRNGNIYHATMKLIEHGNFMKVRGYVGMPLFGKTVIWQRVSEKAVQ